MKAQSFLKVVGISLGLLPVLCCLFILFIGIPPEPPPNEEVWPSWAPDRKRLVYECYLDGPIVEGSRSIYDFAEGGGIYQSFYTSEAADICINDMNGDNQVRLTKDSGGDWHPAWSPDGSHIAFLRQDGIYLITPDGGNRRQLLRLNTSHIDLAWRPSEDINLTWSPQGDKLLFSACLDNPDHDIYVLDIKSGTVTNLTPNSRQHDVSPLWALDGTKVVYLSNTSSARSSNPCDIKNDAPNQLRMINADGSGEKIILDEGLFYASASVSNGERLIFVGYKLSEITETTILSDDDRMMYIISLLQEEIIETRKSTEVVVPYLSPDGQYLAYERYKRLKVLDIETQSVIEAPLYPLIEHIVWSPDNRYIAVMTSIQEDMAIEKEDHIYIFDNQTSLLHPLLQE